MPRPARPWFRFYVEALSDRKLRRLEPAHRWLWVAVLGMARMSPSPGLLLVAEGQPADERDLADVAGMQLKDVRKAMPLFELAGMVQRQDDTWSVTNWAGRQFESDDITERTRKHRSKERFNGVRGNAPETEAETEQPPPTPAERGTEHRGQHANCRGCGTNRRGAKPDAPTSPQPPPIATVLAGRPASDRELNLAAVRELRRVGDL